QVLFAGAVVPVGDMSAPGRAVSAVIANRWAFEGLGRALDLEPLTHRVAAMGAYREAFSGSPAGTWAVLALSALVFAAATVLVLRRRCGQPRGTRGWAGAADADAGPPAVTGSPSSGRQS